MLGFLYSIRSIDIKQYPFIVRRAMYLINRFNFRVLKRDSSTSNTFNSSHTKSIDIFLFKLPSSQMLIKSGGLWCISFHHSCLLIPSMSQKGQWWRHIFTTKADRWELDLMRCWKGNIDVKLKQETRAYRLSNFVLYLALLPLGRYLWQGDVIIVIRVLGEALSCALISATTSAPVNLIWLIWLIWLGLNTPKARGMAATV